MCTVVLSSFVCLFLLLGIQMFITNCSYPEILGSGNQSLSIPRYNEHFACFPQNLFNRGFRYTAPSI